MSGRYVCAECSTTTARTYVVTQLDPDDNGTRTEVCRACDDALRAAQAWRIVRDDDGNPHTECPKCGGRDEIREIDRAERGNRLSLSPDGQTATAHAGDGDWEFLEWQCMSCGTTELDAPEGFEITDWI